MKERGSLLCAGYASTRGYASKSKLRVPLLGVFCRGAWIIEGGIFFFCWLRIYAWLRVKIKAKGTGVGSVLPWSLDERAR